MEVHVINFPVDNFSLNLINISLFDFTNELEDNESEKKRFKKMQELKSINYHTDTILFIK
jgi:hypothetical protein